MKIAIVTVSYKDVNKNATGGMEFFIYILADELVKRGHKVTLFGTKESQPPPGVNLIPIVSSGEISREGISIYDKIFIRRFIMYQMSAFRKAYNARNNYDIIHANLVEWYLPFFINSPKENNKIVITTHAQFLPKEETKYIFRNFPGPYLVFISKSMKKRFAKYKYSQVVYNGIPISEIKPSYQSGEYLAWLGRILPTKGTKEAILVTKKLKEKLFIGGAIDSEEYFREEVKPLLGAKIKYLGPMNFKEKFDFLKKAKAVLIPINWEEPFGLVMIEAMACGTPVIAFNKGAVPEVIRNGITGFIVPPGDINAMAQAVQKIDRIDRRKCQEHIKRRFTIEKMVDGYEKVYKKIVRN